MDFPPRPPDKARDSLPVRIETGYNRTPSSSFPDSLRASSKERSFLALYRSCSFDGTPAAHRRTISHGESTGLARRIGFADGLALGHRPCRQDAGEGPTDCCAPQYIGHDWRG